MLIGPIYWRRRSYRGRETSDAWREDEQSLLPVWQTDKIRWGRREIDNSLARPRIAYDRCSCGTWQGLRWHGRWLACLLLRLGAWQALSAHILSCQVPFRELSSSQPSTGNTRCFVSASSYLSGPFTHRGCTRPWVWYHRATGFLWHRGSWFHTARWSLADRHRQLCYLATLLHRHRYLPHLQEALND